MEQKRLKLYEKFNAASAMLFAAFLNLEIGGKALGKQPAFSFGQDAETLTKGQFADNPLDIPITAIFHPTALVHAQALPAKKLFLLLVTTF